MNTQKLERYYYYLQALLIIFMSLLVAILLSRQTVDSSVLKTSWSLALSFFIFIGFLLRISLYKNYRLSQLEIIVLVFYGWLILNGLLISKFKVESFHQIFKFTSYIIIFLATSEMARKKEFRKLFNNFMILLAGLLIAYGMMQKFNLDIFQWEGASTSRRIISTFGNSIFYANFLLFLLPIIFVNLFKEIYESYKREEEYSLMGYFFNFVLMAIMFVGLGWLSRKIAIDSHGHSTLSIPLYRYLLLGLIFVYFVINYLLFKFLKRTYTIVYLLTMAIFGTFSIIFTLSRGAWLGFIPMFIYIVLFLGYFLVKEGFIHLPFKKIAIYSLIISVVFIVLVVLLVPESVKRRIREIRFSSTTVQVRFTIWKGALKMIRKKPITGFGTGTFQLNFPNYRPKDYMVKTVSNNTINTHSEYLQIAANTGIIGLFLFLLIGFYVVISNIKYLTNYNNRQNFFFALMLGSAILAVLIHSLWSVSMRFTSTVVFFYIYLGLYAGISKTQQFELREKNNNYLTIGIIILLLAGSGWWIKTSNMFYLRDFFVRQGMLADETKGIMARDKDTLSQNMYLLNRIGDLDSKRRYAIKSTEYFIKFYEYWYKYRLRTLKDRTYEKIKYGLKKLNSEKNTPMQPKEYLELSYKIKRISDSNNFSQDELLTLMSRLNQIFSGMTEHDYYKKYLNILVDWIMYIHNIQQLNVGKELFNIKNDYNNNLSVFIDDVNNFYENIFNQMYNNLVNGMSAETVLYYNAGILTDYYTYDCHYKKASAYYDLKQYHNALQSYLDLEKIAPNYTQLHYNKGVVYRKLYELSGKKNKKYLEQSIYELEKSKKLNPYFINTRMILAKDYEDTKNIQKAIEEYRFSFEDSKNVLDRILNPHKGFFFERDSVLLKFKIFITTGNKLLELYKGKKRDEFMNYFKELKLNFIQIINQKIELIKTNLSSDPHDRSEEMKNINLLNGIKMSLQQLLANKIRSNTSPARSQ